MFGESSLIPTKEKGIKDMNYLTFTLIQGTLIMVFTQPKLGTIFVISATT